MLTKQALKLGGFFFNALVYIKIFNLKYVDVNVSYFCSRTLNPVL